MSSDRLFRQREWRSLLYVLGLFAIGSSLALGQEADRFYVMRDGTRYGLIKSDTEYAVTLRWPRDADAIGRRLALTGQGKLELPFGSAEGKVRIVRVSKTSAQRREALRLEPGVEDLRRVYRFAGSNEPVIATGEILVRIRADLSDARRQQLWSDYRIQAVAPFEGLPDVYTLGPLTLDEDEMLVAEALANDPRTVWAQPNLRTHWKREQVVSDPLFSYQWHLHNTGQLGGPEGVDLDVPEAWAITRGEGITFSMFDDSCDTEHPDLAPNYIGIGQDPTVPPNSVGFDNPGPKDAGDRHGTAVMGLMVAAANGLGGRGVAPEAKFTATRSLLEQIPDAQIAGAFTFALAHDVDVHNNSWGPNFPRPVPEVVADAIARAFEQGRRRADVDGDGETDPLGMVVLFSAGNDNLNVAAGFGPSTLHQVINVGASNDLDRRAGFSSYGSTLDIMAPGQGLWRTIGGIFTTDARDTLVGPGYNVGGFYPGTSFADVEVSGDYTGSFNGTSAACPIAAGVAGLILSANPRLTATDVRLILEHTAEQIDPENAEYDPLTSRSLRYGYGRINAGGAGEKLGAVEAAQQSLTNGGRTWPERVAQVSPGSGSLRFRQNFGTSDFLIVESSSPFGFIPRDGACYDNAQPGCEASPLEALPGGVDVLAAGCGLACGNSAPGDCEFGAQQCVSYPTDEGSKFFGIFARNSIGRYSWGVSASSFGSVRNAGDLIGGGISGGGSNVPIDDRDPPMPRPGPAVSVNVSPLRGRSPLSVNFNGNAVSARPIDESKTAWDFDVDDNVEVDARTRQASHVYTVGDVSKTFVAKFTMVDANGNEGSQEVAIFVEADVENGDEDVGSGLLRIIVGLPGTAGSNVSVGQAPFSVVLSIDASGLPGTLQSVAWDLGDGFRAATLTAPHTYYNDGTTDLRLPITATVTSVTSTGVIATTKATRVITVQPGQRPQDIDDPKLPGTGAEGPGGQASPCGVMGMIPLAFCLLSLVWLRRLRD